MSRLGDQLDPVTFEIIRSALANLVNEMGLRLRRVAFSPVIIEGCDYSLALCTPDGRMVASGPRDLPAHVGTLEFTVRAVLDKFPLEEVEPGDVFFLNDPHAAGSHNNDTRVVHPVFTDGRVIAWLISCGHWADIGGPLPGSFNPDATSCFAEGLRIPAIRIRRKGELLQDVVDLILGNVRLPAQSRGDLQAQLEACVAGETRLLELCDKYGSATITSTFEAAMDYSERLLVSAIASWKNGIYTWEDWVDEDSASPGKPPFRVHLTLEIRDGELIFDYRASDPQPAGPSGNPLPMTWSATICALMNMVPGVPYSHGIVRRIKILTEPGSCVHVLFPGPICATGSGVYEKVLACVLNCIGQADPSRRTAAIYNLQNLTIGGTRTDSEHGLWVMYLWTGGGFGGTAKGDAGLPTMMLFAAGTKNQPVEVLERANPIVFDRVAMVMDSMGPGLHRGGPGEERVFHVTEGISHLTAIGDRYRFPIWGVEGGGPGMNQEIVVDEGGQHEHSVGVTVSGERIEPGVKIYTRTGGGGGYGDPMQRDPTLVLDDIIEGYLSEHAAAEQYGVVVTTADDGEKGIDQPATDHLRARRGPRKASALPPEGVR
jgi:N-methylhydantoinase B